MIARFLLPLLLALNIFSAEVPLIWDPSPDLVAGYAIYYGPVGGLSTSRQDAGPELKTTIRNLAVGTKFFFYAVAYDRDGTESLPSNVLLYTPLANIAPPTAVSVGAIPPFAPSNLTAVGPLGGSLVFVWVNHSANETGIWVSSAKAATGPFSVVAKLPPGTTSYTLKTPTGAARWYKVYAINSAGSSEASNTVKK